MWTTGQNGVKVRSPSADTRKLLSWVVFVQARDGQLTADLRSLLGLACLPLLISPVWGRCDGHCVGVAFRTSSEGRPCGQAVRNDGAT